MHPRNKHINGYDIEKLLASTAELKPFIRQNPGGRNTIDFSDPTAVKILNKSLLIADYGVGFWDIPDENLCPPVPGRADYIHSMADHLGKLNKDKQPSYSNIRGLDIGTGANVIYPIIAIYEYGWSMVGSEIDIQAIRNGNKIISLNKKLQKSFEIRQQTNRHQFFKDIIRKDDLFDFTMCNPPFYSSLEEAESANKRKISNLKKRRVGKPSFNFKGQSTELIYEGGEVRFIKNMIRESRQFAKSVLYFSTLVSKEALVMRFHNQLKAIGATEIQLIPLQQGQKKSRILLWSFLSHNEKSQWVNLRWH